VNGDAFLSENKCNGHRPPLHLDVQIISGGQTGVDRAALNAALKQGIECGGWCPAGRLDEFGRIPNRYPVKELKQGSFAERTLQNVIDSDGTLIIYLNALRGGTEFTVECCKQLRRPHKLIDAAKVSAQAAAKLIFDFVREHKIDILNVAGSRQSEWPRGYDYAFRALGIFLGKIKTKRKRKTKTKRKRERKSGITRSVALSPDRGARRNRRESKQRASRSRTH
jgi:hypothetical protein